MCQCCHSDLVVYFVRRLALGSICPTKLFDGRKIRVLTIVDAYSKVSPAIDVRDRYTGADVAATLTRVCRDHGCPRTIRVDNGPEFISRDLDLWA